MLQLFLYKVFFIILAIDIVAAGVMLVFVVNIRQILKKQFIERRFEIRAIVTAQNARSSESAARDLEISVKEFNDFCARKGIQTPEQRKAKKEEAEKKRQSELQRIMEEEASWRAEQEKMAEDRRKEQEEEARKRKDRLRKFGIT
ncbi:hypothetical protein LLG96_06715 [bacterium]|nr:hypothetical protein [bacterium]